MGKGDDVTITLPHIPVSLLYMCPCLLLNRFAVLLQSNVNAIFTFFINTVCSIFKQSDLQFVTLGKDCTVGSL